ncbi:MAG: hypothetical protein ACI9Y1_001598 [Lentisphaeria bacterium]|jgi:hypothetical protein
MAKKDTSLMNDKTLLPINNSSNEFQLNMCTRKKQRQLYSFTLKKGGFKLNLSKESSFYKFIGFEIFKRLWILQENGLHSLQAT